MTQNVFNYRVEFPGELWAQIFSHLSPTDRLVSMQVSKNFLEIANINYVWKEAFLRDFSMTSFPSDSTKNTKDIYHTYFKILHGTKSVKDEIINTDLDVDNFVVGDKFIYATNQQSNSLMIIDKKTNNQVSKFQGISSSENHSLKLENEKIFLMDKGGIITIFDTTTNIKSGQLNINLNNITSFFVKEGCIYAGNNVGTIQVYDLDTTSSVATLQQKTGKKICCFLKTQNQLFSASGSGTIDVWNCLDSYKHVITLTTDGCAIGHLYEDNNKLISVSGNCNIRRWDLDEFQQLMQEGYGTTTFPFFLFKSGTTICASTWQGIMALNLMEDRSQVYSPPNKLVLKKEMGNDPILIDGKIYSLHEGVIKALDFNS